MPINLNAYNKNLECRARALKLAGGCLKMVPIALLLLVSTLGFGASASQPDATTAADGTEAVGAKAPATTLNGPFGLALDSAGNLYVANAHGGNVTIYGATGWKLTGSISSGLSIPIAVAVNFGGIIYVANNDIETICLYAPNLQQIGTINDSSLIQPLSMYIDGNNDLWVLDYLNVHLYLDDGTPISTASMPQATAVGPWGSNVTVWGATDPNGGTDELLQNMGEAVHRGLSFVLVSNDAPKATAVAQDSLGKLYIAIPSTKQVQIWSNAGGTIVGTITTASPAFGVAVDSFNHRLYVAEQGVNEVVVYSTQPPYKILHTIK